MKRFLSVLLCGAMLISSLPSIPIAAYQTVSGTLKEGASTMMPFHLMTDNLTDPIGIDSVAPLFSWRLEDTVRRLQVQTSYRITVADSPEALASGSYVWDSGTVRSEETLNIPYAGSALQSSTRYYWQVETTDKDGKTARSDTAFFETGLMDAGWSGAEWIGRSEPRGDAYYAEKTFTIDFDFILYKDAASFLFGAKDTGNFYMWQLSSYSWHSDFRLRPHTCTNGGFAELSSATLLSNKNDALGKSHHMTIDVDNGAIKTYLDGVLKDSRTVTPFELGYVGMRRTDSEEFSIDNLVVKNGAGEILVQADFTNGADGFEEKALENGKLHFTSSVGSGVFMRKTTGGEVKAESAPMLRKEFTTQSGKTVKSARLYATSAGVYAAYINGSPVTDSALNPGMTAYDDHMLYQTFDVTDLVKDGGNAIGAYLGHGWFNRALRNFGTTLRLYAKLLITYTDGTTQSVVTDGSWKFYPYGPIADDDLFNGFKYDATVEQTLDGWTEYGFDDSAWIAASTAKPNTLFSNGATPSVIAQNQPLIRGTIVLDALSVSEPEKGVYIYDFGQNIAGVARVTASAPRGTKMTLRHAEVLNRDNMQGATGAPGTLFTANLPRADATDTYVFRGDKGEETFEPFFTYHGFRYLEITGLDAPLPLENVKAVLLMTDLEQTSTFDSSNPLVNRLYLNSLWSARDNFMSVPTDCPQRGERFGWTGDAQIFARTGSYLMDVNAFYQKYCMDMRDTSRDNRIIADVSPASVGPGWYGQGNRKEATNGWGDAIIIIPYQIYKQYGNREILEENYQIMCNWMDYLVSTSTDYIRDQSWTGDWLPVNEPKSPIGLTDTAFCAYSASLLAEISEILGKDSKAAEYRTLYDNYRSSWQKKYLLADGSTTTCGTQTSYVLGLKFGLFDEDKTAAAAENLVKNIRGQDWHLTTGFLGLSYLNPILTDYGYADVAYKLLEQETYPSWLYSVTTGSTSIWESWYVLRVFDDGSSVINEESHNHFSYGAVTEWLYRYMLGIERDDSAPETAAFKHFYLKPVPGGSFTYANGTYESPRGGIAAGWTLDRESGAFTYNVTVPANTTATVLLPVRDGETPVTETISGVSAENAEGVRKIGYENGCMVYEVGSGSYSFTTEIDPNKGKINALRIANPQGLQVSMTVDGETVTKFPCDRIAASPIRPQITLAPEHGDYVFCGFRDADGTLFAPDTVFTGDSKVGLVFAYTGKDDGTDGNKTVAFTGNSDTVIAIGGEEHALPYSADFPKGKDIAIEFVRTADGYEFDHYDSLATENGSILLRPLCSMSFDVVLRKERCRKGYDLFFDFEDNIGLWRGMSVALSHEPGYMRFLPTAKDDGTYDPRAYYDFTESESSITGRKYVRASDYESITIGYIADRVEADSYPYMYISTEAQPSYTNPIRGKCADSAITTDQADGKTLREVTFTLEGWSAWTGNIKQIYLDILDNVDGDLRIDYIRLKHRPLTLTVKKNNIDTGKTYSYLPGATVDLTALPHDEGLHGYKKSPDDETYIESLTLTEDMTVYADYGNTVVAPIVWDFDDNTTEGWTVQGGVSRGVTDGVYKVALSTTNADTWLYKSGIGADQSLYRFAVIRMRHNLPTSAYGSKPFEIFFRRPGDGWGQHLSAQTTCKPAGTDFDTYIVDMSANALWNGMLDTLRLDPFEACSTADTEYAFEIDSIALCPAVTVLFDENYAGKTPTSSVVPAGIPLSPDSCPKPTRDNYTFIGWSETPDGEPINPEAIIKSDMVLYAVWEPIPAIVWDFDDGTNQGWNITNGEDRGITDGVYKVAFGTSKSDVWLRNESLNVSADLYKYVVIRMRHNLPKNAFGSKKAELFFVRSVDRPWQQHLSVNLPQGDASETFTDYIFDMTANSHWQTPGSVITHLRFDPFETVSPADREYTFEVDSIKLCTQVTLTLDDGTTARNHKLPATVEIDLNAYQPAAREGYVFCGYTDGETVYTGAFTPTKDTRLTAVWKRTARTETVYTRDENRLNCTTVLYGIPQNSLLIAAGYRNGQVVSTAAVTATGETVTYSLTGDFDTVKVFVLSDSKILKPLTDAETVIIK